MTLSVTVALCPFGPVASRSRACHGVSGRQISRFSLRDDKTLFLFIFCDEYLSTENPSSEQESAAKFAYSFAPKSAFGVTFRNLVSRLLRVPAFADFFIGRDLRDDIRLPDYGF